MFHGFCKLWISKCRSKCESNVHCFLTFCRICLQIKQIGTFSHKQQTADYRFQIFLIRIFSANQIFHLIIQYPVSTILRCIRKMCTAVKTKQQSIWCQFIFFLLPISLC